MKAFHLPVFAENPYQELLLRHLETNGIETVAETRGVPLSPFVHRVITDDVDVVHLHWTHPYFLVGSWTRFYSLPFAKLVCWLFAVVFVVQLTIAAALADRLVWTVHNKHNHEKRYLDIDDWVAHRVVELADRIQAWDERTKREIQTEFDADPDRIVIVPHGNYIDHFDTTPEAGPALSTIASRPGTEPGPLDDRRRADMARSDATGGWGRSPSGSSYTDSDSDSDSDSDPDSDPDGDGPVDRDAILGDESYGKVYLFFGMIREYKNVPGLIDAFVEAESSDACLIVAGNPYTDELEQRVRTSANGHENVRLHLRYIPDDEVPEFFAVADIAVFPYQDVFNSGAVFLSMSFGTAFVAPSRGSIPSIAPAGNVIYDDLLDGLRRASILSRVELAAVGRRNRHVAERDYGWDGIALRTARMYAGEPVEPAAGRREREALPPIEA